MKKFLKIFSKISKNLWKIFKNFLKKFAKMHYFSIVFSQFNEARRQVLWVWTKTAICRKFLKKVSYVSQENCEKCINLADFSQNFRKYALIFGGFGRKRQFIGNFEKIFENFERFSLENC